MRPNSTCLLYKAKPVTKWTFHCCPRQWLSCLNKEVKKQEKVFRLPTTANGCNKMLKQWVADAGIDKNITWHCARHSVGSLLKRKGASIAQIADILGQRSTRYAELVYTRMTQLDEKRALMQKLVS